MRVFEVQSPDGRAIRHEAADEADLKSQLLPGYTVVSEVFGAGVGLAGGYSIPIGGPSLMVTLLEHHGDELKEWIIDNISKRDLAQ